MNLDYQDDTAMVIRHDARDLPLEDESVDLIVTSPPYFALRSYRDNGEHYDGQIGSEDTPEAFLTALDECMVEWGRVLKPSGSVWVNLGDKYTNRSGGKGWGGEKLFGGSTARADEVIRRRVTETRPDSRFGWAEKSLMGLPWRMAIRQIDAGWILRAEVIWSKPNSLPESVTDRVRRSHEQWFHFTREPRYFSAVDEIREPSKGIERPNHDGLWMGDKSQPMTRQVKRMGNDPLGRLPGSVWTIPTEPLLIPDGLEDVPDHFAAFPQEWPRRIILGWSPKGGTVLDPLGGTGTVAGVARMLGRFAIHNDLSADYNRLAIWRIWSSGHFTKTEQRTWADRQGTLSEA